MVDVLQQAKTRIRVSCDTEGWSRSAAYTVASLCSKYKLPFIDIAGVTFDYPGVTRPALCLTNPSSLPNDYVFFAHRKQKDLPHTHNAKVVVLPDAPKNEDRPSDEQMASSTPQAPAESKPDSRKIHEGSLRLRPEFKDLRDKCKNSTSLNEWLTNLHDLLSIPQHMVAKREGDKFIWLVSKARPSFSYSSVDASAPSSLDAVPKCVIEDLNSIIEDYKRNPYRISKVIKTEKPLSPKSFRAVVIEVYLAEEAIEVDEEDQWVLTVKPVIIENGLY